MGGDREREKRPVGELERVMLAIVGLLLVCAVLAQPNLSLFTGFWYRRS